MLVENDYESWKIRIHRYIRGKAQVTGTTSSGPSTSETPKVLAPGMYNLGVKPTFGASKTMPKRAPRNHSSLPVKSANARKVEAHHRTVTRS
ncbi:hypothetical protein Tco_0186663 [Tanacetum coccineum]